MSALYEKYRPKKWGDVVGQKIAVKAMQAALKQGVQQYLLIGPSGCGKTTLARIAADEIECFDQNIMEIPAAVYTGVDDMRKVQEAIAYSPMGKSKTRAVIVDECHRLSKQAWDSLLKVIEEPSKHNYWFFCTTDVKNVPKTIKTRCATIQVNDVNDKTLFDLLANVCDAEKFDTPDSILDLIVKEANGSPRQALSHLGTVASFTDKREAAVAIHSVLDSDATMELCRFIANGGQSWVKATSILEKLGVFDPEKGVQAEGVRIVVVRYIGACLKNAKKNDAADRFLNILAAFSTSYNQSEGYAPLLLSVGRVVC